ncbi:MAG: hypothetical protein P4L60_19940 [Clostridium sp.]|nr:hypothetical protein [Clostridium sp.]
MNKIMNKSGLSEYTMRLYEITRRCIRDIEYFNYNTYNEEVGYVKILVNGMTQSVNNDFPINNVNVKMCEELIKESQKKPRHFCIIQVEQALKRFINLKDWCEKHDEEYLLLKLGIYNSIIQCYSTLKSLLSLHVRCDEAGCTDCPIGYPCPRLCKDCQKGPACGYHD